MAKRAFYVGLACVVLYPLFLLSPPSGWESVQRFQSGRLASKVERFRHEKGRLPSSLSELGVDYGEGCPCYCKSSLNSYVIWYGTTLGHSEIYNSENKKWSDVNNGVCLDSNQ